MPKATTLTPNELAPTMSQVPKSVMTPRSSIKKIEREKKITEPIQLRLPPETCTAIKVEAAKRNLSHSDFMFACFHAYMQKKS